MSKSYVPQPEQVSTTLLEVNVTGAVGSSGFVTQLFLQTSYSPRSQPEQASLAVFCLRMLARTSPAAWLDASADLQAVIAEFVPTQQHLPPAVWVTLPAAINIIDISPSSLCFTDKQLQGAMQPKFALNVIFTAMLRRARNIWLGTQLAADHHLGKPADS